MKAFEVVWDGDPTNKIIYAAESLSKARYAAVESLREVGYARDFMGALQQMHGWKRRPDLDGWAAQFNKTTCRNLDMVCCERLVSA